MAKQNYRQAKRHKELARKARQEEKLRRKMAHPTPGSEDAKQIPTPISGDGAPPSSAGDA